MNVEDLIERYERRAGEADQVHATAPVAAGYRCVVEDLQMIGSDIGPDRVLTTNEAAKYLRNSPKTIRKWIGAGRFPGAYRTSGDTGRWRIPASELKNPKPAKAVSTAHARIAAA